jgi:hypothetical protein
LNNSSEVMVLRDVVGRFANADGQPECSGSRPLKMVLNLNIKLSLYHL